METNTQLKIKKKNTQSLAQRIAIGRAKLSPEKQAEIDAELQKKSSRLESCSTPQQLQDYFATAERETQNQKLLSIQLEEADVFDIKVEQGEYVMKQKALLKDVHKIFLNELKKKDNFKGTHVITHHASERMNEREITTMDLANNRATIKGDGKNIATTFFK